MPTKERNPWESNNETKVVFFSRTVCAKLHFYVIFRAICHFLGTTSSLSFSNRKKKEVRNDLRVIALTTCGGRALQAYESDFIMDTSFSYLSQGNFRVHSHFPQGFHCFCQYFHQKFFYLQMLRIAGFPLYLLCIMTYVYTQFHFWGVEGQLIEYLSNSLISKWRIWGPEKSWDLPSPMQIISAKGLNGIKADYALR